MKNLLTIFFLFFALLAMGQNQELFDEANSAYAEGNYEEAIEHYEQIVENGESSVAVYYNLGNAHYKLNNVAPSIYYYEKALQLDPGDPDVKNNIEYARNMVIDDIPDSEPTSLRKSINQLISTFSYETWAGIAIGFSVLFAALFLLYYFSRKSGAKRLLFTGSALSLLLCLCAIFFAFKQQEIQFNNQHAIVFSEEAGVRNEPNYRGDTTFVLHEGTKTRILEEYQDWVKIELADGTQGWMEQENLRKL